VLGFRFGVGNRCPKTSQLVSKVLIGFETIVSVEEMTGILEKNPVFKPETGTDTSFDIRIHNPVSSLDDPQFRKVADLHTPQNYVTPGTVVTREPGFMRFLFFSLTIIIS